MLSKQSVGWCALVLAIACYNAAHLAADEDALVKAGKESYGTFRLVSQTIDGKTTPEEKFKGLQMTVSNGKWTTTRDGEFFNSGSYKIVALNDGVRQVDGIVEKGEEAGRSRKHIAKQEGEKLTICREPEGKEFPSEFASKPGTGYVLSVWMREKK